MGKVPIIRTPPEQKNTVRLVVGTSTAGWTAADCNYLCDGTDDQVEINAAINALPSTGGEVVVLGGIYNCSAQITLRKCVTLSGTGKATVLKLVGESLTFIHCSYDYVSIQNLTVDGNSKVIKKNLYCIDVNVSNHCTIKDVTLKDAACKGISLAGSSYIVIKGCIIENAGEGGIVSNGDCVYNIVTECIVEGCTDDGICFNTNTSYTSIEGCVIRATSRGILISNESKNNIIARNTITDCRSTGILLGDCSDCVIANNICCNNQQGIAITINSDCVISGNICKNNRAHGICLNGSSPTGGVIEENICKDNLIGIAISGTNHTITGNTCIRGNGTSSDYTESQHTIRVSGSSTTGNLIANNNIMGKNYTNSGGSGNTFTNNKYQ